MSFRQCNVCGVLLAGPGVPGEGLGFLQQPRLHERYTQDYIRSPGFQPRAEEQVRFVSVKAECPLLSIT